MPKFTARSIVSCIYKPYHQLTHCGLQAYSKPLSGRKYRKFSGYRQLLLKVTAKIDYVTRQRIYTYTARNSSILFCSFNIVDLWYGHGSRFYSKIIWKFRFLYNFRPLRNRRERRWFNFQGCILGLDVHYRNDYQTSHTGIVYRLPSFESNLTRRTIFDFNIQMCTLYSTCTCVEPSTRVSYSIAYVA